jgi:histidinol-phosphate aminotransferase
VPSFFRRNVEAMEGYVPGEQPRDADSVVKLNTNENPYPPSRAVGEALSSFDASMLRLYPDPMCRAFREAAAEAHGVSPENIIVGNGSDDILTIATRSFVPEGGLIAKVSPSYTLYRTLAEIQGAACLDIPLEEDFSLPFDAAESAEGASLFFLPRPNAPTGTAFAKDAVRGLCERFDGVVLIDEAYAAFADDDCLDLPFEYPNAIVSRTLSKSHSLAGARLGYAIATEEMVAGMMKVKDSYNVNALTQALATAAIKDGAWLEENVRKIRGNRAALCAALRGMGFDVVESAANFVLASPPDDGAKALYERLKSDGVFVRWFDEDRVRRYVRITVGTEKEIESLLSALRRVHA